MTDEEVVDAFWAGNCSECSRPPRGALVQGRCDWCAPKLEPYEVKAPDKPLRKGDHSLRAEILQSQYPPTGNPRLWVIYGKEGPPGWPYI